MGIFAAHLTNLAPHTYAAQPSESNTKVIEESKEPSEAIKKVKKTKVTRNNAQIEKWFTVTTEVTH
jgi:hypothetical protein